MPNLQEPYNQLSINDENAIKNLCNTVSFDGVKICEIGCWLGHGTEIFARHAKKFNGSVFCIDTFKGSKGTFLEDYADKNNVYLEFKSNMVELGLYDVLRVFYMNSSEAYKYIDDNTFDLIFVDGDHIYNQVKEDINNYLPKLKDNGIFSGHDFEAGFDLDLQSLTDLDLNKDMSKGFHCGVIKAVNERFSNINLIGDRVWWSKK